MNIPSERRRLAMPINFLAQEKNQSDRPSYETVFCGPRVKRFVVTPYWPGLDPSLKHTPNEIEFFLQFLTLFVHVQEAFLLDLEQLHGTAADDGVTTSFNAEQIRVL